MTKRANCYFTVDPDGKRQIHYITAQQADGAQLYPADYHAALKTNARQRELLRLDAKKGRGKIPRDELPEVPWVYCQQEICGARKILYGRPSADGTTFVHKDRDVPDTSLRFVHCSKNSKFAANPKCPDYHPKDGRYAKLSAAQNRAETRKLVLASIRDPDAVAEGNKLLEKYLGKRSAKYIEAFRRKFEPALADNPVLIDHPELWPALAVLKGGQHAQQFPSSGDTYPVIFKPSQWHDVEYNAADGNKQTRRIAKEMKLWFVEGRGRRPPGSVQGWTFVIELKEKKQKAPAQEGNALPPAGAPAPPPPEAQPAPVTQNPWPVQSTGYYEPIDPVKRKQSKSKRAERQRALDANCGILNFG